jgi:hypothetical protein
MRNAARAHWRKNLAILPVAHSGKSQPSLDPGASRFRSMEFNRAGQLPPHLVPEPRGRYRDEDA